MENYYILQHIYVQKLLIEKVVTYLTKTGSDCKNFILVNFILPYCGFLFQQCVSCFLVFRKYLPSFLLLGIDCTFSKRNCESIKCNSKQYKSCKKCVYIPHGRIRGESPFQTSYFLRSHSFSCNLK